VEKVLDKKRKREDAETSATMSTQETREGKPVVSLAEELFGDVDESVRMGKKKGQPRKHDAEKSKDKKSKKEKKEKKSHKAKKEKNKSGRSDGEK
jgi:hypothetical protein